MTVAFVGTPAGLERPIRELARGCARSTIAGSPLDLLMIFANDRAELDRFLRVWARDDSPVAALWLAWPKKSSGRPSDLTDVIVREVGLATGRVDVKVCSVDRTWSALRFVSRRSAT